MSFAQTTYDKLHSAWDAAIQFGPPTRLVVAHAASRCPRGAQQFSLPRFMFTLKGAQNLEHSGRHAATQSSAAVAEMIYTAPMAWTKASYQDASHIGSLVCHHGFTRFVVFEVNNQGQVIPETRHWLHSRNDTSIALRQGLSAVHANIQRTAFDEHDEATRHLLFNCLLLSREELQHPHNNPQLHTEDIVQYQWREACAYIDEHCHLDIMRSDIAQHLAVHPNHVPRIFKQCNDHFPKRLELARLNRAVALLQNPQMKITDIAQQCGFQSSTYFIRRFKQQFSTTPSQYRQK